MSEVVVKRILQEWFTRSRFYDWVQITTAQSEDRGFRKMFGDVEEG